MKLLRLAILIAILSLSTSAHASEPDDDVLSPAAKAFASGTATALVPFFAGTSMIVLSDDRPVRNGGVFVIQSGLTLAPFVAHAVVGEAKRGAYYAIIPGIGEAGMGAIMIFFPDILSYAPNIIRYGYAIALTTSIFGAAFGIVDAMRVGDRAPKSASRIHVTPIAARGFSGLAIGGEL